MRKDEKKKLLRMDSGLCKKKWTVERVAYRKDSPTEDGLMEKCETFATKKMTLEKMRSLTR